MADNEYCIKKLTPALCEDWLDFFDNRAFCDHKDWGFCYCLEGYISRKEHEEWTDSMERRKKAAEMIKNHVMQGYLVYSGDVAIAWCNTNDRKNYVSIAELFQTMNFDASDTDDSKVKSIYCFLVAPDYRGKGIAQKLLERITLDAVNDGYEYLEAYPFSDSALEFQYHGTVNMYIRNGFQNIATLEFIKVMRKKI